MFPFCAVGLIFVPLIVNLKPKSATVREKLVRIDWLGGSFFICSATLFLIAISWGGTQYRWDRAATLAPLCIGAVGLIWTLVYESCFASVPFLHVDLFQDVSSAASYICGLFQGLVVSEPNMM